MPWVYNGNFSPVFERRKGRKNRGTYSCHGILRTFFLFISTHKISSPDHRTPLSKPLIFFFPSSSSTLLVYSYLTISSQIFENIPQNGPEYSHRNLASGYCGEKKHRGLAVLVGLIVKLSPRANTPWVGKGPPRQSLGGKGAAKAWYVPLVLLWESQCTGHVCL